MTNLESIAESFQGLLAQVCLSALFLIASVCAAKKFFAMSRSFMSRFWRASRMGLAAVALLAVAMSLWADKTGGDYVIAELCNYVNAGMWN